MKDQGKLTAARSKTTTNTKRYLELYNTYLEDGKVNTNNQRYVNRDRWEEKRLEVLADVRTLIGNEKPKQIIETLAEIGDIKGEILAAIASGINAARLGPSDYDKMVRLEQFLQGEPDSRPDLTLTLNQVIQRFEGKTNDELLEILKDAQKRTNRFIGNSFDNPN